MGTGGGGCGLTLATGSPLNTSVTLLGRGSCDDLRHRQDSRPPVFEITLNRRLVPESPRAELHDGKREAAVRGHLKHSLSRGAGHISDLGKADQFGQIRDLEVAILPLSRLDLDKLNYQLASQTVQSLIDIVVRFDRAIPPSCSVPRIQPAPTLHPTPSLSHFVQNVFW